MTAFVIEKICWKLVPTVILLKSSKQSFQNQLRHCWIVPRKSWSFVQFYLLLVIEWVSLNPHGYQSMLNLVALTKLENIGWIRKASIPVYGFEMKTSRIFIEFPWTESRSFQFQENSRFADDFHVVCYRPN